MQILDDLTIDNRHPQTFGRGVVKGGDLTPGQLDLGVGGRKGGVGDGQLRGMDQGLAVKPQVTALRAFVASPASSR